MGRPESEVRACLGGRDLEDWAVWEEEREEMIWTSSSPVRSISSTTRLRLGRGIIEYSPLKRN